VGKTTVKEAYHRHETLTLTKGEKEMISPLLLVLSIAGYAYVCWRLRSDMETRFWFSITWLLYTFAWWLR
jgi:hypothetical protein